MLVKEKLNGLEVEKLSRYIDGLRQEPANGQFTFQVCNKWINGVNCRSEIKDFKGGKGETITREKTFVLEGDEPKELLGQDIGPNATEGLLNAVAGCLSATFVYHASNRGIKVNRLDLDVSGDIDLRGLLGLSDKVRNGFERINVTFKVDADAPRDTILELVGLAQKRSPVFDMVTNPTPVVVTVE